MEKCICSAGKTIRCWNILGPSVPAFLPAKLRLDNDDAPNCRPLGRPFGNQGSSIVRYCLPESSLFGLGAGVASLFLQDCYFRRMFYILLCYVLSIHCSSFCWSDDVALFKLFSVLLQCILPHFWFSK
ncbi:hypothetical protein KFK09_027884 [Dendrobium nobile]|uniref:Uncharacterized protein n=1 Tax=Dendrobium nobile TaxID=94219 RepID=A0A8T3A1Z6_DENNO|nr:hypothetical protein KFK09_027884 [Dendrobium nobile]